MKEEIKQSEGVPQHEVHMTLAHSYLWYFIPLIIAVFLDLVYPIPIFEHGFTEIIGFIFLILSTLIILWAQNTSRNLDHGNITKESFCRGPYCYTRTPTHWGIFLLVLSFGVVTNAFFVVLCTVVSFLVTKFLFVKKQEAILEKKYGDPYLEYKKSVKF